MVQEIRAIAMRMGKKAGVKCNTWMTADWHIYLPNKQLSKLLFMQFLYHTVHWLYQLVQSPTICITWLVLYY